MLGQNDQLIFTTSKQYLIHFKFVCNISVLISYLRPKIGFVIISTEIVWASQTLVVLLDLAMPTNKLSRFCNKCIIAEPHKKVNKYLKVKVCLKVECSILREEHVQKVENKVTRHNFLTTHTGADRGGCLGCWSTPPSMLGTPSRVECSLDRLWLWYSHR